MATALPRWFLAPLYAAAIVFLSFPACTVHTGTRTPTSTLDGSVSAAPPIQIPRAPDPADAVFLGSQHSCVLSVSGKVACWGRNKHGQLGNGDYRGRELPVEIAELDSVAELALGRAHSCARLGSGKVWCWGDNAQGQLGDGRAGADRKSPRPVLVTGLNDAVELVSGDAHLCARRRTGAVVCWGDNRHGQLANRTRPSWSTPVAIAGLADARSVAAGASHSCALRSNRSTICWGSNRQGQLGDGSTRDHERPSPVRGLSLVSKITASGTRSCAVHVDDRVSCWGAGNPHPQMLAGLRTVAELALGPTHACARDQRGTLRCWGNNSDGRLGDGSTRRRIKPGARVELEPAKSVAVGSMHSCAVTQEGKLYCWGDNREGLLGGRNNPPAPNSGDNTLVWPRGIESAIEIVAGGQHSCALADDSTAVCWGDNRHGQLGDRSTRGHQDPIKVAGLDEVIALAAGKGHSCAAKRTGDVFCWGDNKSGQVSGARERKGILSPVPVPGLTGARAVAAGDSHSCAIVDSGKIRCWGSDEHGQLGDGPGDKSGAARGRVTTIFDAVELSLGARHSCARRRTGTIVCWGENRWGQLGNGAGAAQLKTLIHAPVNALKVSGAAEVASGSEFTCARMATGSVVCWGRNDHQQLGSGTRSNVWTTRVPAKNVVGARTIASGARHVCVGLGGEVSCWGDGEEGQLGRGSTRNAPLARPGPSLRVKAIAAGDNHSCALLLSGEVACWGSNKQGQLGSPKRTFSARPQRVERP